MEIRREYTMGTKMTDEALDRLFEKMDRETARKIDNQHTPTKKTPKKATTKKTTVKKTTDTKKTK